MADNTRSEAGRNLVYGEVDKSLLFIPEVHARDLAVIWEALRTCTTWGEFRRRVPPKRYREVLHLARCESEDGDAYVPTDAEPFPGLEFGAVADGDYPEWAAQEMLYWAPPGLVDAGYGRVEPSFLNGPCLTLDPRHVHHIVPVFQAAGFRCRLDDDLVRAASGWEPRGRDPTDAVNAWIASLDAAGAVEFAQRVRALVSSEPAAGSSVARVMEGLGPTVSEGISNLMAALGERNDHAACHAADALGSMNPAAAAAIPELLRLARDAADPVSEAAIRAIVRLAVPAATALPTLIAVLERRRAPRLAAASALGQMGQAAAPAVPALIALLSSAEQCKDYLAAARLGEVLRILKGSRDFAH